MTFPELLIVMTLIALTAALVGPKTLALLQSAKVASARVQLAAVAEAARAGALQRQRAGTVRVVNSASSATATLTASVDTGGPQPYVVQRLTVGTNVTPRDPADTLVTYDARGGVTPRRALVYFVGPNAGPKDSVCLSSYGHVLPRSCAP